MLERELIVPYNTMPFYEWCDSQGVDWSEYETLYSKDFVIAKLMTDRLSRECAFRQEVEASLPLVGCKLVEAPDQHPGGARLPMLYMAPDGMAFEIESNGSAFAGRYLGIDVYIHAGETVASITIKNPEVFAGQVFNPGGHIMAGPSEENMIRLPSKYVPDKDGAWISFSRFEDWAIIFSSDIYPNDDEFTADYGEASVELIPDTSQPDNELYVADFGQSHDQKLDDFIFIEEGPVLPPGFFTMPSPRGGYEIMHNAVARLTLPPIDQDAWSDLWYEHRIMIKVNPTVADDRFVYLDYARGREYVARQVREFNSSLEDGRMFQRILVVRNMLGRVGLSEVIATGLSRDKLAPDEQNTKS